MLQTYLLSLADAAGIPFSLHLHLPLPLSIAPGPFLPLAFSSSLLVAAGILPLSTSSFFCYMLIYCPIPPYMSTHLTILHCSCSSDPLHLAHNHSFLLLRSLQIRKTFPVSSLEDMEAVTKLQLAEYIIRVQADDSGSLECPFGVRCTTVGEGRFRIPRCAYMMLWMPTSWAPCSPLLLTLPSYPGHDLLMTPIHTLLSIAICLFVVLLCYSLLVSFPA